MRLPTSIKSTATSALAAATLAAGLAGCSSASSDDINGQPVDTTIITTTTTAAPELLEFDADEAADIVAHLDTEEGREMFIDQMVELLPIEREDAECFLDNTPQEALDVVGTAEMDNEDIATFLEIIEACDIPLGSLTQ